MTTRAGVRASALLLLAVNQLPTYRLATIPDEDLAVCAVTEAGLTHPDPITGKVSATCNSLRRSLICGRSRDVALRQSGFEGDERPGNNGGFAPNVLRAATYFLDTSDCFTKAM
jgi:hypothetical protein